MLGADMSDDAIQKLLLRAKGDVQVTPPASVFVFLGLPIGCARPRPRSRIDELSRIDEGSSPF